MSVNSILENDSFTVYKAISSWHGRNLGLSVKIPTKEGAKGFGTGIEFKSIGVESDYFLQTLSSLYDQKTDSTTHFKDSLTVAYVNLVGFSNAVTGIHTKETLDSAEYKLFFESKNEGEEAELYLNVNRVDKWLEIREKDSEYRPMVINFLRK